MPYTAAYILVSLYMVFFTSAVSAEKPILNLVYTGAMEGELEPCGCSSKTDFGGMARFAGYLQDNKEELSPYILIDAGNFSGKDTPQGRLKTEAMLKAFSAMDYDVVAFSEKEKKLPQEFLSPFTGRYKTPAISDMPEYGRSILLKRGDLELNISVDPEDYQEDRLNILLTDRSLSEARLFKGWDIIILSSGEVIDEPLRINGTIILSGYPKGKRLGILTITGRNGDGWSYRHRWQVLGSDSRESSAVRSIIDEYDSGVEKISKRVVVTITEGPYSGVLKCAECHQPFVESWEKTRHANALDSLRRAGKSGDPECLQCHTVGYGKSGGFLNNEATPGLANVQCEACHGPGREHLQDFSKPMAAITEETCKKCHTAQNSPDFNFMDYLKKTGTTKKEE